MSSLSEVYSSSYSEEEDDEGALPVVPDSYEFLKRFPVKDKETEVQYMQRVADELKKVSEQNPNAGNIGLQDLKKKRIKRQAADLAWDSAVEAFMNNARNFARVSFLLELNSLQLDILINYALRKKTWGDDLALYVFYTARRRLKSNFGTWKSRSLAKLISYIRAFMEEDVEDLQEESNISRIHRLLEKRYNPDDFVNIFD
ncbi:hypothetical protein F5X96DRAFT_664888 [Biscogniauxia mediterranea]|nr:hypothetical protein F5X96DRAFT_664888 [Biscogniauxia mediterranea]